MLPDSVCFPSFNAFVFLWCPFPWLWQNNCLSWGYLPFIKSLWERGHRGRSPCGPPHSFLAMTFGTRHCCQLSTYRKQLRQLKGSCWCLLSLLKVPPDSLLYASFWPLLPSFFLRLRLPQWHWGKTKIHIKKKLGSFCALLLPAPCSPGHAVYPLPYIHTVWALCIRSCLLLGVCLTTNAAQLHLWQCLRALEEKRENHNTLLQILKKKIPLIWGSYK